MVHLKIEPISEVRVPQPITPWQDVLDLPGVTWQHFVCCLHLKRCRGAPAFPTKKDEVFRCLKPQHIVILGGAKLLEAMFESPTTFLLGAIIVGAMFAFPSRDILYPKSSNHQSAGGWECFQRNVDWTTVNLFIVIVSCSVMVCLRICFIITRPGETEWSLDYRIVLVSAFLRSWTWFS